MSTQNVVYTQNGILFSPKKEGNSDTGYTMDELEDITLKEMSQSQKDKVLSDSTYMRSLEPSDSQRQKVEGWMLGQREGGGAVGV